MQLLETRSVENIERLIRANLDWWALAGVDLAISERPSAPLPQPGPSAFEPPSLRSEAVPEARETTTFPDRLDAFLPWLTTSPQLPEMAQPLSRRIVPRIVAEAALLLVTDAPVPEDCEAGALFAGEAGHFVTSLLTALGRDRPSVSEASLYLAAMESPDITPQVQSYAAARLRHLIGLAQPKAVLAFGDRTSRALSGTDGVAESQSLPFINHDGATIPIILAPSLSMLMRRGDRKAALWRDMRGLAMGI